MDLNFEKMRETARRFRRKKALAGEFPARERTWPRSEEKQQILEQLIMKKLRRSGVYCLKDGTLVLLGSYSEETAAYLRAHGEFPPEKLR